MKANLSGLGGIKSLLLMHGEKIGIAVVGLCVVGLLYATLQHERLEETYQPAQFDQKIKATTAKVNQLDWNTAVNEFPEEVRRAETIMALGDRQVPADPYMPPRGGWNPPVIPPTIHRTDPELLAAVDVEARGGSGLLAFNDEARLRQWELEQRMEEERRQQEQERAQQDAQQQQDQRGGRAGRGAPQQDRFGGLIDPEHPNRRAVDGMARAMGVQLQGGERIDRAHWAVVTAKVPIREQRRLYDDALMNAREYDPEADFPRYDGYFVQRAEVRPGQPLRWQRVEVQDGQGNVVGRNVDEATLDELYAKISTGWAGETPEVVDERYLDFDGVLALPLPPLVGREWGMEATHSDIPLAAGAAYLDEELDVEQPLAATTPVAAADADDDSLTIRRADPNRIETGRGGAFNRRARGTTAGRGGRGGRGGYEEGMVGGYGGRSPYGRGGGRGDGGEFVGGMGRGGMGTARTRLPRGVDHWLLRFFDFTVEPGKKYKYRVLLAVADPNRDVSPSALDSAVASRIREEGRRTFRIKVDEDKQPVWSEPSPTVGIPVGGSVRLAEVKMPTRTNDEPTATLLVTSFDLDEKGNAIQATKEKDFRRGAVANFEEDTEALVEGGRSIDELKKFNFRTGVTLLDIAGGQQIARDYKAPASVLLMDSAGELMIRRELDDSPEVEMNRHIFAPPDQRMPGGRGMMMEEMMRGPGGRGRFMEGG